MSQTRQIIIDRLVNLMMYAEGVGVDFERALEHAEDIYETTRNEAVLRPPVDRLPDKGF